MIDLHLHSDWSDGHDAALTVAHGCRHFLAWALTDHDTTAGYQAIRGAPGLLCGVEVSAALDGQEVHIVALGIRPDDQDFQALLADIRAKRRLRLGLLLERLPDAVRRGLSVKDFTRSDDHALGRAHLARALVRRGAAQTMGEVFATWLGDEHTSDPVLNPFPAPELVCTAIRAAGGVSILAHPAVFSTRERAFAVADACGRTLDGIERDSPGCDAAWVAAIDTEAERRDWLLSRGSDRHRMANRPLPDEPLVPRQWALLTRLGVG